MADWILWGKLMEQKIELKPCPFCGKKAVINTIEPHAHIFVPMPDYEGGAFIECTGCTCVVSGKTEHEAVEAWNRMVDNG